MDEYIDRNELIENLNKIFPERYSALINQLITNQPTADVVKVVRCGQCKWHLKGSMSCGHPFGLSSDRVMTTQFCSEGELKL